MPIYIWLDMIKGFHESAVTPTEKNIKFTLTFSGMFTSC